MIKINKKVVCLALLMALLAFHIINNIVFISIYPMAEGKDSYAHITAFNNFCRIIENGKLNPFYIQGKNLLYNLVFTVIDYPPFFYLSAFLFKFMFGGLFVNAALLTATFYFLVLLIAVYSIGEMINPETGIIAAFICGMYPMIFLPSRHFSLELTLCALITVSILLLLKTDCFLNRKFSLLLGIALGLGMLTKQTFLVYIAGPFLIYGIYSSRNCRKETKKRKLINIFICTVLFLGISSLFYLNKDMYINVFNRAGFLGATSDDNLFSFEHISYYIRSLRHMLGIFFTLIFLASFLFVKKISNPLRSMFIAWIGIPMVFFTLITLKYAEYTISFLPAIALISAAAIVSIKQKKVKSLVIMIVLFSAVLNYYNLTFARSVMFYSTYYAANPRCEIFSNAQDPQVPAARPAMREVINYIGSKNHTVGIFYDNRHLDFPAYLIRALFSESADKSQIVDFLFRTSAFAGNLYDFDVFIYATRSQEQWTDKKTFKEFIKKINNVNSTNIILKKDFIDELVLQKEKFELMYSVKFQTDNAKEVIENVYIYKRKK